MKKNQNTTVLQVATKEVSEGDFIEALENFAQTSAGIVGVERTYDVLGFLTNLINESPDTYHKITRPDNVERFKNIVAANSGKTPGIMEAMSIMGELKEIFA